MDPCLFLQCIILDRLYIKSFCICSSYLHFSVWLFVGNASWRGWVKGRERGTLVGAEGSQGRWGGAESAGVKCAVFCVCVLGLYGRVRA